MTETIKKCRITGADFVVTDDEQKFCEMMNVPFPTLCPEERIRRLMMERNARSLYYRTCDSTGKKILSQHHPDMPFPVFNTPVWWGDTWDAADYGVGFDFSRPFFEQFLELKNRVPHMATYVIWGTLENSDFTNCTGYLKNCYLISECDYDEDCYFSNRIYHSKDIVDCSNMNKCELCYECLDCTECNRLRYCEECSQCSDSYALYQCRDCHDCIGCINQHHKKHMIFNVQYTPEEYEAHKAAFELGTRDGVEKLRVQCDEFFKGQPHKPLQEEHNQNSTGDHLYHSKNSFNCFDSRDLEDCRNCMRVAGGVKSAENYVSWGFKAEKIYMCSSCGDDVYNLRFCSMCTTNVSDSDYCYLITGCSNCFGCVGLKKKKYCILNKQYTKEEYEKLVPKIIEHMKSTGEWGKYLPPELCSFAYNEAIVMENFPLSKEEVLARGYRWREEEEVSTPDEINDKILKCEVSGKFFKLIPQELRFHDKLGIPIPSRCPRQRHTDRCARRNTYHLYDRACAKCSCEIKSAYSPRKSEVVYCQNCYLQEAY
ncbi:hypothetical protein HOG48_04260 [Candidatus Peregrinibacteria bacterium]|nr:hypothetical protein [Candidatus Peregrinibacteria bacterium]